MIRKAKRIGSRRLQSLLLAILFTISLLPPVEVQARTGDGSEDEPYIFTAEDGAVVLTEEYSGTNVIIQNGVFSVTVKDATDINIIFENVTIDRRAVTDTANGGLSGKAVPNLYAAAQTLGWGTKAPVCPFLITGNSTVTAGFRGTCTFYAGTNSSTVDRNDIYKAYYVTSTRDHTNKGCGYAGIQVDKDATLTIQYAEKLTVYGAHQLDNPKKDGTVSNGMLYSDVLRANASISAAGYENPYGTELYNVLNSHEQFAQSGGAGIGGGAAYNTPDSEGADYTQGTPGTIIINGGNIEAFGGYAAAGIGGGVNSAATQSSITINGGNVIAHGGRFAAGIGDGDSVPNNDGGMSTTFETATGRIEINGGTVTAYGGVASPGIGCSDDISETSGKGYGADATRKLEIAINGGAVNAFSGFPSGFTGANNTDAYPDETPAAIGAGSISNMESNSIYISSAAILTCAGFGNYALTEIGDDADAIPVINVDSDGYLLLLRTEDYFSTHERVLELWKPQYKIHPELGTECVIYVDQTNGKIYYVDIESNLIYNESFQELEDGKRPTSLTLYVDGNSEKLDEIHLAYFFRSIALTLPHPEEYGGLYAITVPTDGIVDSGATKPDDKHIILTVEAYEQGTQSGVVQFPSDHNMGLDITADRFTDLDTYEQSDIQLPADGLIGDAFFPGVFAYTVYVDTDVNQVTIRAEFEDKGKGYRIFQDTGTGFQQILSHTDTVAGDPIQIGTTIDLGGASTKTVRLKKMDNNSTLGAIVYKITIVKKSEYCLQLSDPTKTYDGTSATATATGGLEYNKIVVTPEKLTTPDPESLVLEEKTQTFDSEVYISSSNSGWNSPTTYYYANLSMELQVVPTGNAQTVRYILLITTSPGSDSGELTNTGKTYGMGWEVSYKTSGEKDKTNIIKNAPDGIPSGTEWRSGTGNNNRITIATGNGTNLQLQLENNGSVTLRRGSNASNVATLFSIGNASSPTTPDTFNNHPEAKAAAYASKASGTFPYEISSTKSTNQTLNVVTVSRNYNTGTVTKTQNLTMPISGTKTYTEVGYYEVVASYDPSMPSTSVEIPPEDLEQANLTYYEITTDADGNLLSKAALSGPPKDAGTYLVEGRIETLTYTASGSQTFTIHRREVRVQQITKWLLYVPSKPDATKPMLITAPGDILLENVVSGDNVTVYVNSAGGDVFYNPVTIGYSSEKITLRNAKLEGADVDNYVLYYNDATDPENKLIYVFGQIALNLQGSTFRKTLTGSWRKYYPEREGRPVGDSGNPPDYHSPADISGVYRSHAEYVLARTVNHDSGARYAVDIEFGTMQFGFYRGIWDVNQLAYIENVDSVWTGMDGTNNRVVLTNYSNAEVFYQVNAAINFMYAAQSGSSTGITAKMTSDAEGNQSIEKTSWTSVAAATPGDSTHTGSSGSGECYLFLSGVPQLQESSTYIDVGTITVTVAPRDLGTS